MTLKGAIPYDDFMSEQLKDKDLAVAYLNECLEGEEDLTLFLRALKRVIDAQGVNVAKLSRDTGLNRESLYKMLSERGNPKLKSVKAVVESLGYKIAIQ